MNLRSAIVALVILSASACAPIIAGGAAGAGTAAFLSGQLDGTAYAPLDRVYLASQDALDDLQLLITEREKDGLSARIDAQGAENKKVRVHLEEIDRDHTRVEIRVGMFGDEDYSRRILEEIQSRAEG